MGSIFISYAREDKDKAANLAFECTSRGGDPWWDRELLSGERYIESILRQVAQADHFLLLLSASSASSNWVAFEVGAARAREFAIERDFIKIVNLDNSDVPGFLGERNAILWNTSEERRALMRSLGLPEDIDYKAPAGKPDRSLVVFKTGGQWMELIVSHRGLECVLVDVGEQRARIQWQMTREKLKQCLDANDFNVSPPREHRGWSTFNVGGNYGWRWSPVLFSKGDGATPAVNFEQELKEHLKSYQEF